MKVVSVSRKSESNLVRKKASGKRLQFSLSGGGLTGGTSSMREVQLPSPEALKTTRIHGDLEPRSSTVRVQTAC